MNITASGFDKVFDGVVRAMPLPGFVEEGVIGIKNILKDENVRENILDIFNNLFNRNGNIVKNIWDVKDTIKEKGIKQGVSQLVDIAITNAKMNKNISTSTAKMLKDSKDIIVEEVLKEKNNAFSRARKNFK